MSIDLDYKFNSSELITEVVAPTLVKYQIKLKSKNNDSTYNINIEKKNSKVNTGEPRFF